MCLYCNTVYETVLQEREKRLKGWKCIAIHRVVLQRRGLSCIAGLYCRKLGCREIVSQFNRLYCDFGAKARLECIAIECPAKPRYGKEAQQAQAERWAA